MILSPRLSIIIPSYNQEQYLEETLLSIINQDYPDLEIIVIDGGSTDSSIDIIKKYALNISYWVSEKDRGQSHAINKGLEKATGEWVAWMNSDDMYLPGAFHHIFDKLDHENADFIFGNTCCGESLSNAKEYQHDPEGKNDLKDILKFFFSIENIIPSQSVFVRRSILVRAGLLDESIHYCMDFEWYCRIFLATERKLFYPKTVSFFRLTPTSKTGSGNNNGSVEALAIAEKYADHLEPGDRKGLFRHINYYKKLQACLPDRRGFTSLVRLAFRYPDIALGHASFKVKLKQVLKAYAGH